MARNTYSQDETLERKFDLAKLKRALVYLKPHKAKLVTAVLLSSLSSILSLLPPYMLSKAIDNAIPDENVKMLYALVREGIVDVKIVIRNNGMYHDKLALLEDFDGNVVACVGSNNETGSGYGCNYEKTRVYYYFQH